MSENKTMWVNSMDRLLAAQAEKLESYGLHFNEDDYWDFCQNEITLARAAEREKICDELAKLCTCTDGFSINPECRVHYFIEQIKSKKL